MAPVPTGRDTQAIPGLRVDRDLPRHLILRISAFQYAEPRHRQPAEAQEAASRVVARGATRELAHDPCQRAAKGNHASVAAAGVAGLTQLGNWTQGR
jgi:hypothetical protein